jgi:hypothetical protein
MSQIDFETLVALLAEERDPLVLEEIVCLHGNDGDTELLEKMKDDEERLHAELATMKAKSADAHRWFDVSAAMAYREGPDRDRRTEKRRRPSWVAAGSRLPGDPRRQRHAGTGAGASW